jgi:hypothetical protein
MVSQEPRRAGRQRGNPVSDRFPGLRRMVRPTMGIAAVGDRRRQNRAATTRGPRRKRKEHPSSTSCSACFSRGSAAKSAHRVSRRPSVILLRGPLALVRYDRASCVDADGGDSTIVCNEALSGSASQMLRQKRARKARGRGGSSPLIRTLRTELASGSLARRPASTQSRAFASALPDSSRASRACEVANAAATSGWARPTACRSAASDRSKLHCLASRRSCRGAPHQRLLRIEPLP